MDRIFLALLCCLATAPLASAAEYGPVPVQPPTGSVQPPTAPLQPPMGTAPRLFTPNGPSYSLGMPSLQRPPIHVQHGHHGRLGHSRQVVPAAPLNQGWTGYGFGGVPTYQWGYFGARYRPMKVYHRGYYGHRMSYGYRRGY
jgi:hypothetical protein